MSPCASFRRIISHSVASVLLALSLPGHAETTTASATTFTADNQPLFPAGNLNVFKQYVLKVPRLEHTVGKQVQVPLGFDTLRFGGSVTGSLGGRDPFNDPAAFGLELGLCFGGQANYELTFCPSVTLPDAYPFDIPLPLTVSEGFQSDTSFFATQFPPLGKAYADLIFEVGAAVRAEASVFGTTSVDFGLSTCTLPPPLDGFFKESTRCDNTLTARPYCALELLSWNRNDDACLRMLNVFPPTDEERAMGLTTWLKKFLAEPYLEKCPEIDPNRQRTFEANKDNDTLAVTGFLNGEPVEVSSSGTLPGGLFSRRQYYVVNVSGGSLQLSTRQGGVPVNITSNGTGGNHAIFTRYPLDPEDNDGGAGGVGKLSFGAPTINTSSASSSFNTDKVLRSSGAEDIMGLGIDVAALLSQFFPPPIPPLSDAGSVGPIDWHYNFASLNLGPAIQLQTDFEMTWDIEVTRMTFTAPDPPAPDPADTTPRSVTLYWPEGSPRHNPAGEVVTTGSLDLAPGTVHLTNCGPKALPMVELPSTDPVEIHLDYTVKPRLKTVVSVPIVGQVDYQLLEAGASISRVGGIGFGPLVDGAHKFKFGEFIVYESEPRPIAERSAGFSFVMQAAGPPRFAWSPRELAQVEFVNNNWFRVYPLNGPTTLTNWREVTDPANPIKGKLPGLSSHVDIFDSLAGGGPAIFGFNKIGRAAISSLKIGGGYGMGLGFDAELTVQGGLIENSGSISANPFGGVRGSTLRIASPDAVLCGPGEIALTSGSIRGVRGVKSSFNNYNIISGSGDAMDRYLPTPYDLFHLWDFDNGDAVDSVSGVAGELRSGAVITDSGEGRTGRGLRLGPGADSMEVANTSLFKLAAARDQMTLSFWQKLDPAGIDAVKTNFLAESPSAVESAGFRVHAPWTNRIVYFDTAGCCGTGNRIETDVRTEDFGEWVHFAFVKDGSSKEVWIDGVRVVSGANALELPTDVSKLWIGSAAGGTRSVHGLLDDVALFGLPLDGAAIGLIAAGTRPNDLPFDGTGAPSTVNNMGTFRADSGDGGILSTSADNVLNQGLFEAKPSSDFLAYGGKLTNSVGSRIVADGREAADFTEAEVYLSFDEAEHAGLLQVKNGGYLNVASFNSEKAQWSAGQSFANDVGFFRSENPLSNLELLNLDLTGGCLMANEGGSLTAADSNFMGSVLHIGDYDPSAINPESGYLRLVRYPGAAIPGSLKQACVLNHGTVAVDGWWQVEESMLFANNGTVKINPGGRLTIMENLTSTTGASDSAKKQPGCANITGAASSTVLIEGEERTQRRQSLLGGTWDLAGFLDLPGTFITALGATSATADTGHGSVDDLGGEGRVVSDQPGEDASRLLSGGAPAEVILRGPSGRCDALNTLAENRGELTLRGTEEGPAFLLVIPQPATALINRNRLTVAEASSLSIEGGFVQRGSEAVTDLREGGRILSTSNDFRILGGTVTATADSRMFNLADNGGGKTIPFGTKVRIESEVVDTGLTNGFGDPIIKQSPVVIKLGAPITTIGVGGTLVIKGAISGIEGSEGIYIDQLNALATVNGTLRLEGDGFPYSPVITLGDLSNGGEIQLAGRGCTLNTGAYTQSGGSLRVGADARVAFGSGSMITGGNVVVEISSRPRGTQRGSDFPALQPRKLGPINVEPGFSFNDRLVIDFTGDVAASMVDVGDRWQIVPRGEVVAGFDTIEYRLDGAPLPPGWLPAGTELQTFQYGNDSGGPLTGLGVRVVPTVGGLQSFGAWAQAAPRNLDPSAPFADGNGSGEINLREYFFGLEGRDYSVAGDSLESRFVAIANPDTPSGEDLFFEFNYVRPRPSSGPSPDASYIPYFSENMRDWFVAQMLITDIGPAMTDFGEPMPDLEKVTLRSVLPVTEERMFMRIQPSYNPDDFEPGLIPEKPLNWNTNFVFNGGSFQQTLSENNGGVSVSYDLEPGRVLFLNIPTATAPAGNRDVVGTDVYHQESPLQIAAVHALALGNGDSGIVKVTFAEDIGSYVGSPRNEGTNDQVISSDTPLNQGANDLSYTIELVAAQADD